jgi:hypothetical protein
MAYVDFAINDSGDLLFSKRDDKYKSLNIKFNISKTKVQKISFLTTTDGEVHHKSDNYLQLSFTIEDVDNKTTSIVYKDDTSLAQLISLQLKDTLGELSYRTDDGSKLSLYKHQNINKDTLRALESYLQTFLADYLYNPIVKATPVISYTNGYKQAVELFIYNDSNLLLQYKIES